MINNILRTGVPLMVGSAVIGGLGGGKVSSNIQGALGMASSVMPIYSASLVLRSTKRLLR